MRAPCSHLRISVTAPVEPSHPTCSGTYVSNSFQESPAPVSGKCVPLLPTCSRSSKSQMSFAASSPTRSASTGVPERASVGLRTFRAHQTDGERRLTYSSSPCSERDTYGLRSCHQDPWPWLRVLWPHKVTLRGSKGHAHPWRTSLACSELAPCCGYDFGSVALYVKRSRGVKRVEKYGCGEATKHAPTTRSAISFSENHAFLRQDDLCHACGIDRVCKGLQDYSAKENICADVTRGASTLPPSPPSRQARHSPARQEIWMAFNIFRIL